MSKKSIYLIIIIIIIATCSFAGGYHGSKRNNQKENNTTNEAHLTSNTQENYNENVNELNTSKNESSKESSSSSKTSTKEEKRIVYLDVYHRNDCGFCNNLLNFLNDLDNSTKSQMVIRKHDVTKEYDNFQTAVKKYGNNEGYGVPYVVFNNEKALTGYSKDLENKYKTYINDYIK